MRKEYPDLPRNITQQVIWVQEQRRRGGKLCADEKWFISFRDLSPCSFYFHGFITILRHPNVTVIIQVSGLIRHCSKAVSILILQESKCLVHLGLGAGLGKLCASGFPYTSLRVLHYGQVPVQPNVHPRGPCGFFLPPWKGACPWRSALHRVCFWWYFIMVIVLNAH